jgi:hypothetical protein
MPTSSVDSLALVLGFGMSFHVLSRKNSIFPTRCEDLPHDDAPPLARDVLDSAVKEK